MPYIIHELGEKGGKVAVVLTAGLGNITDAQGRTLKQAMLDAAKPHLLRILGPNCVGLLVPGIGLNASFAHTGAQAGRIAFVSQSRALTTALLDWAGSRGIGFSHFISLGDSADVDFGDVLDYLAADPATRAILLYIESVQHARRIFIDAGIPTHDTPEQAVDAFMQLVEHRRNQELLTETPPSAPVEFVADTEMARPVVRDVLAADRKLMSEPEAKAVLMAYGIPVVATRIAESADDAARIAAELGFPVALKILSPEISHKSDVGGVGLNLASADAVQQCAVAMAERIKRLRPDARLTGFTVQQMVRRPGAHELIVGVATDAVFGPVVLFGQGGTAVEVIRDRAIALPPLNLALAREVVARTRVAKLLAGYRDRPAADHDAIYLTLVQIAQLIADIPGIIELDINPLLADEHGVIALDVSIRIAPAATTGAERFAIRPYPKELEESILLAGKQVLLRPIRPEDEPQLKRLIAQSSDEDTHFRFFHAVRELPHSELARFTQIDYDREMAFVAITPEDGLVAEVRTMTDPDNQCAEFAILVLSGGQYKRLGYALLEKMVRYCRARGTGEIYGEVLAGNARMLRLARALQFKIEQLPGGGEVRVCRRL